jgi:hypothetical protein
MSDANILRGQTTFKTTLDADIKSLDVDAAACLKELQTYFWDRVGIMPMNGLYAAKRIAAACLKAAVTPVDNLNARIALAIDLYENTGAASAPAFRLTDQDVIKNRGTSKEGYIDSGDKEHDDTTKELANTIKEVSHTRHGVTTFLIEDEDGEVHNFDAEVIDMLGDAAAEGELSVEGMRAIGLIEADFDTTKNSVSGIVLTAADNLVHQDKKNWRIDNDGFLVIMCPACESEKIYPMGENMFGCFDCDKEFEFRHNLGDVN